MADNKTSIFTALRGNMRAYAITWVTTFFASIVNAIWTTYVFHFDFVSSIDGALASQIGVVLLNELYLLWTVIVFRKSLFSIGAPLHILLILLNALFILLLIYSPMMAFKAFGAVIHAEISGHSPIYDQIASWSDTAMAWALQRSDLNIETIHTQYGSVLEKVLFGVSVVVALAYVRSFFSMKKGAAA